MPPTVFLPSPSSPCQASVCTHPIYFFLISSASGKPTFHSLKASLTIHSTTQPLVHVSSTLDMSSAELIAEILTLSSGLESFNQFQILSLSQSNNLFAFAPELISFSQSCGSELQQLLELSQSSIFNNMIETNLNLAGSVRPCLDRF